MDQTKWTYSTSTSFSAVNLESTKAPTDTTTRLERRHHLQSSKSTCSSSRPQCPVNPPSPPSRKSARRHQFLHGSNGSVKKTTNIQPIQVSQGLQANTILQFFAICNGFCHHEIKIKTQQ